jgi:hypothetical protein
MAETKAATIDRISHQIAMRFIVLRDRLASETAQSFDLRHSMSDLRYTPQSTAIQFFARDHFSCHKTGILPINVTTCRFILEIGSLKLLLRFCRYDAYALMPSIVLRPCWHRFSAGTRFQPCSRGAFS